MKIPKNYGSYYFLIALYYSIEEIDLTDFQV